MYLTQFPKNPAILLMNNKQDGHQKSHDRNIMEIIVNIIANEEK